MLGILRKKKKKKKNAKILTTLLSAKSKRHIASGIQS